MTALQKGHITRERATALFRRLPVKGAVVCWSGGMVMLTGVGAAALAQPASAVAAGNVVGVADANADNRTGADGAINVDVREGVFLMSNDASDPLTIADIRAACYVTDDNTVSKTNGGNTKPQAGTVYDIDPSGAVWVKFD